jgi:hypothetical protein
VSPRVAIDADGNATVAWYQPFGGQDYGQVWAAWWRASGPPDAPALLDTQATPAEVAAYGAGHAVAVWTRIESGGKSVWGSWSALGAGWDAPERLSEAGANFFPTIALDSTGSGFVVWVRDRPGVPIGVRAGRAAAGRWEQAQELQPVLSPLKGIGNPHVAVGNNGTAVAVYFGLRDGQWRIFGNDYRPDVGWGAAQLISPQDDTVSAAQPRVGVDRLGNAVAVWSRIVPCSPSCGPPGFYDVVGRRFDAGLGWQEVVIIAAGRNEAQYPRVAVDPGGNALTIWNEDSNGSSAGPVYEVWAARLTAGAGWGAAQRLQPQSAWSASWPLVALDAGGNATAVWARGDGKELIIWAARFLATSGWGAPEAIGTAGGGGIDRDSIAIAVNPRGDGIAAWPQSDGAHNSIWVNRFTAGGSTPQD